MNNSVKKVPLIAAVILAATFALGTAGSSTNPLVSLMWLGGEYRTSLVSELDASVKASFDRTYNAIVAKIDGGTPLTAPSGYTTSPKNGTVTVSAGQTLLLAAGTGFSTKSGTATATISEGVAINLTEGTSFAGAFIPSTGVRYLLPDGSAASMTVTGSATLFIDGYYKLDGTAKTTHDKFTDVKLTDWFYDAVEYAYANGLFSGTSDTQFSPNASMTRGMFVTVLYRMSGSPNADAANVNYSDITDRSAYYATPVSWAASNGIVTGYEDGTFAPNAQVTREQMAAIMYRYASWRSENVAADATKASAFPDYSSVSSYAKDALNWACDAGIISGSDGRLLPQGTATRAQVAQIVLNFMSR